MKKIFQPLCLIILFSVIFYGCNKDLSQSGVSFTPYADVINPPDSFNYYIPLNNISMLRGKIQFSENAVWQISKTSGVGTLTWVSRIDKSSIFNIIVIDTVALEGNLAYYITGNAPSSAFWGNINLHFVKTKLDYQSYSHKF